MIDPKDGGLKSRKFWYCIGTGLVIVGASRVVPSGLYEHAVDGLVLLAGIYTGGNAAIQFFASRVKKPKSKEAPKPE